jgi:hypothetical protein
MSKKNTIWKARPDVQDYAAAHDYLSLVFAPKEVSQLVKALRHGVLVEYLAKDLLRASQVPLLERGNSKVAGDLKKIGKGKKISPVLLVRGDARRGVPLTIADGYHRICASWYRDEDAPVACCLVNLPKT